MTTTRDTTEPVRATALPSSLVPEGSQYDNLRGMLLIIERSFPSELSELSASRVAGWVAEIDSGTGRSDDDIRDDIAKFVITEPVLQNFLDNQGITDVTPEELIAGGNEGGVNFSDLVGDSRSIPRHRSVAPSTSSARSNTIAARPAPLLPLPPDGCLSA